MDLDTVIVGGGQAGLALGYHLRRAGVPFAMLDAHARVGDAWRQRWDSLTLFTPLYFLGLPWQRTRGSAVLGWVGRDAEVLAARLAEDRRLVPGWKLNHDAGSSYRDTGTCTPVPAGPRDPAWASIGKE
ncbi:NAD(P)-binding protein [Micromonospora sp. NPDC006766]|uniref:NAD(P)-binding protein n=1 Tax=Micromonospora sp. NPDC006766 TaxID=3154778 RepID=UPI003404B67C